MSPFIVAHHLALAAVDSGEKVCFIHYTFKPTLAQLFKFYQNSAVRTAGLKGTEQLLETPELKLKQPADTHWLSHDAACQTLYIEGATCCYYKLRVRIFREGRCLGSWFA